MQKYPEHYDLVLLFLLFLMTGLGYTSDTKDDSYSIFGNQIALKKYGDLLDSQVQYQNF